MVTFATLPVGQVYPRFNREKHLINELPFPLENEILKKIGIDFNVMNCNAVVCVTAGNKLIVVDEIVKQQDTDAMAREIRSVMVTIKYLYIQMPVEQQVNY